MPTVPFGARRVTSRSRRDTTRRTVLNGVAAALATAIFVWGRPVAADSAIPAQVGHASWYGEEFASRLTASGERFDPQKLTGPHPTLPLGSKVRLTNLQNLRTGRHTTTGRGTTLP